MSELRELATGVIDRDEVAAILARALRARPGGLTRSQLDLIFTERVELTVSAALLAMLAAGSADARLVDGRILYSLRER
jgi:hypothetical protein